MEPPGNGSRFRDFSLKYKRKKKKREAVWRGGGIFLPPPFLASMINPFRALLVRECGNLLLKELFCSHSQIIAPRGAGQRARRRD